MVVNKHTFVRLAHCFHLSSTIFCLIYWVCLILHRDWHYSALGEQVKGAHYHEFEIITF